MQVNMCLLKLHELTINSLFLFAAFSIISSRPARFFHASRLSLNSLSTTKVDILSQNSAKLSWESRNPGAVHKIEYVATDNELYNMQLVADSQIRLSGLTPGKIYKVTINQLTLDGSYEVIDSTSIDLTTKVNASGK